MYYYVVFVYKDSFYLAFYPHIIDTTYKISTIFYHPLRTSLEIIIIVIIIITEDDVVCYFVNLYVYTKSILYNIKYIAEICYAIV